MQDNGAVIEAARWLRYAREDLEAAYSLMDSSTPRHSCLLAQQSAEKAIKSIYAYLDLRIPKSHDLDMLKNLLPEDWEVKKNFLDLSELSFWAVESRYPGDVPEATQEDAEKAVALARDVLMVVESNLTQKGFAK